MSYTQSSDMPEHGCYNQVVGMAYVPVQRWKDVYEIQQGFCHGTIFAELDKPWMVGRKMS